MSINEEYCALLLLQESMKRKPTTGGSAISTRTQLVTIPFPFHTTFALKFANVYEFVSLFNNLPS